MRTLKRQISFFIFFIFCISFSSIATQRKLTNVKVNKLRNTPEDKTSSRENYFFGKEGREDGQFKYPSGIAIDSDSQIYVTDVKNHRIQIFKDNGQYIGQFNGEEAGYFKNPSDIDIDNSDNIYVADRYNHQIKIFDKDRKFLLKFGSIGNQEGQFLYPTGLAIDDSSKNIYVYVADLWNHRIQKFDSNGKYLTPIGSKGEGNGQFNNPTDVAVDDKGHVYVTDRYNHRVQIFDKNGVYLTQFGSKGKENGQFNYPSDIIVDASGTKIYVVDLLNNRVEFWSKGVINDNSSWKHIKSFGKQGCGEGEFLYPTGIAMNESNIYVSDLLNHRVQIFDQYK